MWPPRPARDPGATPGSRRVGRANVRGHDWRRRSPRLCPATGVRAAASQRSMESRAGREPVPGSARALPPPSTGPHTGYARPADCERVLERPDFDAGPSEIAVRQLCAQRRHVRSLPNLARARRVLMGEPGSRDTEFARGVQSDQPDGVDVSAMPPQVSSRRRCGRRHEGPPCTYGGARPNQRNSRG